jgi:hypothetical protein
MTTNEYKDMLHTETWNAALNLACDTAERVMLSHAIPWATRHAIKQSIRVHHKGAATDGENRIRAAVGQTERNREKSPGA